MDAQKDRMIAPDLESEQFIIENVQLTGVNLGAGVEEMEIPGARVAAKKLHSQLVDLGSPEQVRKWVSDFVEECKLLSQLCHPHIVQFLGVCYLPGSPLPALLMEKLVTSLDNLLETSPNIPLDVKVYLLTGTVRGVVYLHSRTPPITHCNLTARNILIDSGLTAKIADFGVAKMVAIQPGQLAATTILYMPPEAVQEEGATRYNTSIDMFSFGVISLFTLTQVFPKELKPHTYRDPTTRRLIARSEIERREDYIGPMKTALGETHPLVKLTLDCLEYDPEDRPSAVEVLRRLEEVETTIPQNYMKKLELTQQFLREENPVINGKEDEIQQTQVEPPNLLDKQLLEKETRIHQLQAQVDQFQTENDQLRRASEHLQAEKQEESRKLDKLASLHQEELAGQRREIERLTNELRSSKQPSRALGFQHLQESNQRYSATPSQRKEDVLQWPPPAVMHPRPTAPMYPRPSAPVHPQPTAPVHTQPTAPVYSRPIMLNWRRCKDIPDKMDVYDQPVAIDGKLYIRGRSEWTVTVLEYTPDRDQWAMLPPLPVNYFTIATLRGQLLVVGGKDKVEKRKTNTIITFSSDKYRQEWVYSYPTMPVALTRPAVVGYENYLIVAGGWGLSGTLILDVNVLDTNTNNWMAVRSLPRSSLDQFHSVVVGDTMYLVGQETRTALRAHVPTLLTGARSDVWQCFSAAQYYRSSPIAAGNMLLTLGGSSSAVGAASMACIQRYDFSRNQWSSVGVLPKAMYDCYCVSVSEQLFVLGGFGSKEVYTSSLY